MSNLLHLDFGIPGMRAKRPNSVLGLHLDGSRLDVVAVRRTNGSVVAPRAFSVSLSLDPLTNAPELVGRELRNHLDAEGVREKRCVVALPLKWILVAHTKLPELSEADLQSFLAIEAERGFPCDVATLVTGTSIYRNAAGEKFATLVAVPRAHVAALEAALRAAQLRPSSFALALPALEPPAAHEGQIALLPGETHMALQVSAGGGLVALRALEGAFDTESGHRKLQAEVVARELRITLAQMPPELRQAVRQVRIHGPREVAQQLADEIDLRFEPMNFEISMVTGYSDRDFNVHIPRNVAVSPAFSLATRFLSGEPPVFEFLPPRISGWQQMTARYSAGKLQKAGIAAAFMVLALAGAFGYQEWRLRSLRSEWKGMEKQVAEVRDLQKRVTQFRPWHDNSLRGMTILKRLTEAFPEDGSVTAKMLEIRDPGVVTCTGLARDYQALLKTVERLRAAPEIPDVSLGPTRGNSPALQFSFSFVWTQGGQHAN